MTSIWKDGPGRQLRIREEDDLFGGYGGSDKPLTFDQWWNLDKNKWSPSASTPAPQPVQPQNRSMVPMPTPKIDKKGMMLEIIHNTFRAMQKKPPVETAKPKWEFPEEVSEEVRQLG